MYVCMTVIDSVVCCLIIGLLDLNLSETQPSQNTATAVLVYCRRVARIVRSIL